MRFGHYLMELFDFSVGRIPFQLHQQLRTDFTEEMHKSNFACLWTAVDEPFSRFFHEQNLNDLPHLNGEICNLCSLLWNYVSDANEWSKLWSTYWNWFGPVRAPAITPVVLRHVRSLRCATTENQLWGNTGRLSQSWSACLASIDFVSELRWWTAPPKNFLRTIFWTQLSKTIIFYWCLTSHQPTNHAFIFFACLFLFRLFVWF